MAGRKKANIETQVSSSDTVFVALNRPFGIKFKLDSGRTIEIQGNGQSLIGTGRAELKIGTYGLTRINREDWEAIKAKYGWMKIFKNELIFANEQKDSVLDAAEERAELRNGLEPIDVEAKTQTKPFKTAEDA